MNVSVKILPKSQAELTIEVSVDELQPFLIAAAAKISTQIDIPGFRPGKAPYDIIKERAGEGKIYEEAAEDIIKKTYPKAVIENKLEAVGQPQIALEKLAPGNPMVYKAIVTLLPKINLGEYKKLKARKKTVTIEAKEIEKSIESLRRAYGKEIAVDRPAEKGDKVEIDFDVFMDMVPIDGGASKNHPLIIGEGHFIPGFEENLIGLAKEEVREFKLRFPKDYHKKSLAGRLAEFKVRMKAIYKIELPEKDDNFAKMLGTYRTFAEVQEEMSKNLEADKKIREEQRFELEIIDEIIDRSKFGEMPELLINSELDKMMAEIEHDISHQGMKFEDYLKSLGKSQEQFKTELKPQADKRIKTALVIRHIAKSEKIQPSSDEIDEEIKRSKKKYQSTPEVLKELETPEYRMYLLNVLASRKVMRMLKDLAK